MPTRALSLSLVSFPAFTAVLLAAAVSGCAAAPQDADDSQGSTEEQSIISLSTFGKSLVGTFTRLDGSGAPERLTLAADGTYAADRVVQCFRAPCPMIHETGRFTATGTGTTGTLTLKSSNGTTQTFAVTSQNAGAVLELSAAGRTQHMARAPMVCGGITGRTCASMAATVEIENGRPALYVQTLDGSVRRRLFLNHIVDNVSGNDETFPLEANDTTVGAIDGLAFSADGARLAFVASPAMDASQVIILDLDTGIGHVASRTNQYVMGRPDWSRDGKKLAYAMSVRSPLELEFFTTDLVAQTATQITAGTGLPGLGNGLGMRSRLNTAGDAILFSRAAGAAPGPVDDRLSDVDRVALATSVVSDLASGIVGTAVDLSRDEKKALVLRVLSIGNDGVVDSELRVHDFATGAEKVLLPHGQIESATFAPDGTTALALIDTYAPADGSFTYSAKRVNLATGASTNVAVPSKAWRLEVFLAR
jgi:hypothetical protein